MAAETAWRREAEHLIALYGAEAIGTLVDRIADAVRLCDDHAVRRLDFILQLVEERLEAPWRLPTAADVDGASLTRPWGPAPTPELSAYYR